MLKFMYQLNGVFTLSRAYAVSAELARNVLLDYNAENGSVNDHFEQRLSAFSGFFLKTEQQKEVVRKVENRGTRPRVEVGLLGGPLPTS